VEGRERTILDREPPTSRSQQSEGSPHAAHHGCGTALRN